MAQRTGTSSRTGGGPSLTTTPTGYQLSSRRMPSGWPHRQRHRCRARRSQPQGRQESARPRHRRRLSPAFRTGCHHHLPRRLRDRVIVEETMSATLASGNAYVNDYCCVFELHGGLVHRVREYMDTAWCSTRPPNLGLSGGGHDGLPYDQRDNSHHRSSRVPEAPQLRTLTMPHVQRDRTSMHMVDGAASQLARSRGRPPGSPDAWP